MLLFLDQNEAASMRFQTDIYKLVNNCDWYTTTIHQTKYSRWNINNCGAGTPGQEKRYMHINVHTLTHIYKRGDEILKCTCKMYVQYLQMAWKQHWSTLLIISKNHTEKENWISNKINQKPENVIKSRTGSMDGWSRT